MARQLLPTIHIVQCRAYWPRCPSTRDWGTITIYNYPGTGGTEERAPLLHKWNLPTKTGKRRYTLNFMQHYKTVSDTIRKTVSNSHPVPGIGANLDRNQS
eukprot:2530047-Rhodomonas_salina.1